MRAQFLIPVIASILILGTLGLTDAFAGNHGNNGNNGCVNANPNAKACENNPNTNHPPTIGSVTITQNGVEITATNDMTTDLVCNANDVTDIDDDFVTLTFEWFDVTSGDLVSIGTDAILPAPLPSGFPFLQCVITPDDGTDGGVPVSGDVHLHSCSTPPCAGDPTLPPFG